MATSLWLVFASLLCFALTFNGALRARKELRSTATGTCESRVEIYGYECEEHTVTTADGYILSIQRIPTGRSGSHSRATKVPVLLQHGLMMDGVTWLLNSPHESLGYILADNGYDVWIANSRGTVHSLGHTSLSSDDSAYWNWSWDELTAYDLPATLQYVYKHTDEQRIHYVGHSLGTLIVLASISEPNHLSSMLRSAALLGPIAFMDKVSSPLARAAADIFAAEAYYWLGLYRFNPSGKTLDELLDTLCVLPGMNCFNKMTAFTGKNCCLNNSAIQVFLNHEPQSTATKNLIHLTQMIRRGTLTKYDYDDDDENIKYYGQSSPPAYNTANIPKDLPLFISHGGTDKLSDVEDVKHLLDSLKAHDRDKLKVQYVSNYAHADFVMAVNAKQVIYDPIMFFFQLH